MFPLAQVSQRLRGHPPRDPLTMQKLLASRLLAAVVVADDVVAQCVVAFDRRTRRQFLADMVTQGRRANEPACELQALDQARKIIERDPFASLDVTGVGAFVEMGVRLGREAKPGLKVGVCGEHGGDPASIRFFDSVGLDYVSASPYRVPVARLAAAQSALALETAD